MKKFIILVGIILVAAGCGKGQETSSSTNASAISAERQEASRKLVSKSLTDLQNKDLKSAIASLEGAIVADPTSPEAYLLMTQILIQVKEFDRATEFIDQASKALPNNGTVFYMMAIANRMAGKKLPAVLAARRSAEIFQAAEDKDNFLKSGALLQELINTPDEEFSQQPKNKPQGSSAAVN